MMDHRRLTCFFTTSPIALSSPVTKLLVALDCSQPLSKPLAAALTTSNCARKTFPSRDLEILARAAVQHLRTENQKLKTVFLINSRTDIALSCGAQGVHLRSNDISPSEVRKIWSQGGGSPAR